MGLFEAAHGWGSQRAPLPKICHTCPTIMKPGTVIPYLRKIKKIHKSRDKPYNSADISIFSPKIIIFLLYKEIQM